MQASGSKRRAAVAFTALATPAVLVSTLLSGTPASAATGLNAGVPSGKAVVALRGVNEVSVPGVTVDLVLSSIHSELVHGSAEALHRLALAPGVLGVAADRKVKPTSHDVSTSGRSVYSWQGLGDEAGRRGAGRGAHVALIDTGVSDSAILNRDSGHLVDAIDTSGLVTGGSVRTQGEFDDGYGHGTFMASLIAGGGSVKPGRTVGVAPGAVVDVVKVAGDDGVSSFGSLMAGLNWVAQHANREDVANLSFGLTLDVVGGYGQDPLNLATETVRYLGTNVVVSSGNTAGQVTDPGFDPWVITVGAADTRGWFPTVASFSGSAVVAGIAKPDLVAPGSGLLGVLPPDSTIVADNPQALQPSGLYRGSGTSEATAVVSGLAALFISDNPNVTTAQVKASLRVAATPIYDHGSGAGLANVVDRLARSRDDRRMGDEGASGEATFDSDSWGNNAWGSDVWGSVWNRNRWGTAGWATQAWSALSWDRNRWGSEVWDRNRWGTAGWASQASSADNWDRNRWGSEVWDRNRWGTADWARNRWGADTWGGDFWGSDGGDGA